MDSSRKKIRTVVGKIRRLTTRILHRATRPVRAWGAKSGWIASMYYTLFDASFRREQRATLAGLAKYETSLRKPGNTMALLRRNTHRLEKGLLMRPRRALFAQEYLPETVEAYRRCRKVGSIDGNELQWSRDVLASYFDAVKEGQDKKIDRARVIFAKVRVEAGNKNPQVPYVRDLEGDPPVSYENLFQLAVRRRSARWFAQRPVDRIQIDRAIEIGCQAPSACNRQPFEFRIIQDQKVLDEVLKLPVGVGGYSHNIPCLMVVVGKLGNYFSERDRHLIYIDSSLATMGVLLALETLGLSSCCINWPDIEEGEKAMARLLGLEAEERPVMLVAIGHPDSSGMVARSTKKSLATIRRYNFE